jgi:small subunit ribosomal protein S4
VRKGDVIELRTKAREFTVIQWNSDVLDRTAPAWIETGEDFQVTVRELPIREQIDIPVREQLIVELYSK